MIPPAFEYARPATISDAIALLQKHGEEAKVLSGGQSLIPMMKLRLARPAWLIDINAVPGLAGIQEEGGSRRHGSRRREGHPDRQLLRFDLYYGIGARGDPDGDSYPHSSAR